MSINGQALTFGVIAAVAVAGSIRGRRKGSRSIRSLESELEGVALQGAAPVLEARDGRRVRRNGKNLDIWVNTREDWVAAFDAKWNEFDVSRISDFIEKADLDAWFPGVEEQFSVDFWAHPIPLYHATQKERVQPISTQGLRPMSQSRGLSNRGTGVAVFTTQNEDEAFSGSYGPVVYKIDTKRMRDAGMTPFVSEETPYREFELRRALAHLLDAEYEGDLEYGISPDTVIIHDPVPVRFLTRVHA